MIGGFLPVLLFCVVCRFNSYISSANSDFAAHLPDVDGFQFGTKCKGLLYPKMTEILVK